MDFKYFDAHSHLHDSEYDSDREAVLARMRERGVGAVAVGTKKESSRKAVELAEQEACIFASVGIHPTDSKESWDEEYFLKLASRKEVVAIGECGLDYFRMSGEGGESEKERQKALFLKHLELSVKVRKPLMIHCRSSKGSEDAHNDLLALLLPARAKYGPELRGNMHFFTGTKELAEKFLALQFSVSFPGVITFAPELERTVRELPLDSILSETDSPYASPIPYRGKRNEPSLVVEVAEKIALLRKEGREKVLGALVENAQKTFGLRG